jgi:hypothetical protein
MGCLEKDLARRTPSCRKLCEALEKFLKGEPQRTAASTLSFWLAAALLLTTGGFLAYSLWPQNPPLTPQGPGVVEAPPPLQNPEIPTDPDPNPSSEPAVAVEPSTINVMFENQSDIPVGVEIKENVVKFVRRNDIAVKGAKSYPLEKGEYKIFETNHIFKVTAKRGPHLLLKGPTIRGSQFYTLEIDGRDTILVGIHELK